ncbi:lantibiotic dehydratase [Streptomyces kaempferi]
MLRVAGLPVDTVIALRTPEAAAWAVRAAAEEDRLVDLGAALSDPLSAVVGATEDAAQRRRLLALRRNVFNNRVPNDLEAARTLAADIGGDTGADLTTWLDARVRWDRLHAEGEAVLAAGLARTRTALRELALDDRLRQGLLLASPTLEERLDAFAADPADPAGVPGKRTRKMERSLLSYVYRTACKTSPFSTLTGVALGTFRTPAEEGTPAATRVGDDWTGHCGSTSSCSPGSPNWSPPTRGAAPTCRWPSPPDGNWTTTGSATSSAPSPRATTAPRSASTPPRTGSSSSAAGAPWTRCSPCCGTTTAASATVTWPAGWPPPPMPTTRRPDTTSRPCSTSACCNCPLSPSQFTTVTR